MWIFGKKISISKLLKDEETEEAVGKDDVSFAPEIERRKPIPERSEAADGKRREKETAKGRTAPAPVRSAPDDTADLPDEEETKALFGNIDLFDDLDRVVNEEDVTGIMDDDLFPQAEKSGAEPKEEKPKEEAAPEKPGLPPVEELAAEGGVGGEAEPEEESEALPPLSPDLFADDGESENDALSKMIAGIVNKEGEKTEQTIILPAEEFYSLFEEKGASLDAKETPEEIFERLTEMPYTSRTYALYDDRLYLSCSDGEGGLYLFEEFGEYKRVQPGDCKVFVKLPLFEGSFRGKSYKTADFEYVMQQHAMKLQASAFTAQEQEALKLEGYLPEKRSETGKGKLFSKSVSLYRMKDLFVRADITTTFPVLLGESYQIALQRSDLEEVDCEKQFKKLCRRIIDCVLGLDEEPFFNLQVLKVRRNIAVCFPLEGVPAKGDLFAGGEINALAQTDDGSYILQVGQDDHVKLPLAENKSERGQHRLSLPAVL